MKTSEALGISRIDKDKMKELSCRYLNKEFKGNPEFIIESIKALGLNDTPETRESFYNGFLLASGIMLEKLLQR